MNTIPPPLPPQFNPSQERQVAIGRKIFMLALQCIALMIIALVVWVKVYDRESTNNRTVSELSLEYGGSTTITGPMMDIDSMNSRVRPQDYRATANVESFYIHRNIYEAEVYNAHVKCSGSFVLNDTLCVGDSAMVTFFMPMDRGQIYNLSDLEIAGQRVSWEAQGSEYRASVPRHLLTKVFDFSTTFDVRGSNGIYLEPIGACNTLVIEGQAANPSFQGRQLPISRTIKGRKFKAEWVLYSSADKNSAPGAEFLIGVDHYQKVSRSMKYAFLIIVLTYITVFFSELLLKHPIPLLNYFLIGAALVLFYVLLLSFVEHISFGWAYLIAAAMTVLLISLYMYRMLMSRKVGITIGILLTVLYIVCFVLLTLGKYALLMGSLLLFLVLALLMYASLRIKH